MEQVKGMDRVRKVVVLLIEIILMPADLQGLSVSNTSIRSITAFFSAEWAFPTDFHHC